MNMEITGASKEAEKVSVTPGMITVYSDKKIEQYGYYTLSIKQSMQVLLFFLIQLKIKL